jgi:hypothetical protein
MDVHFLLHVYSNIKTCVTIEKMNEVNINWLLSNADQNMIKIPYW